MSIGITYINSARTHQFLFYSGKVCEKLLILFLTNVLFACDRRIGSALFQTRTATSGKLRCPRVDLENNLMSPQLLDRRLVAFVDPNRQNRDNGHAGSLIAFHMSIVFSSAAILLNVGRPERATSSEIETQSDNREPVTIRIARFMAI